MADIWRRIRLVVFAPSAFHSRAKPISRHNEATEAVDVVESWVVDGDEEHRHTSPRVPTSFLGRLCASDLIWPAASRRLYKYERKRFKSVL